jgi:hypothetical protein
MTLANMRANGVRTLAVWCCRTILYDASADVCACAVKCRWPTLGMIEHNVGVRASRTVEFKRLDEDFFSEDD